MGGRGTSSTIPKPPQPPQPRNFRQFTDADAANFPKYDINLKNAIKQYARADQQASGYSVSQDLNHKLENGLPLNANEQNIVNQINRGQHDIGVDTILHRGAHADVMAALGVPNYANMTDAQLKAAVVGTQYQERKLVSTAFDKSKSPFLSGPMSGGREVVMEISTPSGTKVVYGNPQQAEIVLTGNPTFRVTDASFVRDARGNKVMAHPKNGPSAPQVLLKIEIV